MFCCPVIPPLCSPQVCVVIIHYFNIKKFRFHSNFPGGSSPPVLYFPIWFPPVYLGGIQDPFFSSLLVFARPRRGKKRRSEFVSIFSAIRSGPSSFPASRAALSGGDELGGVVVSRVWRRLFSSEEAFRVVLNSRVVAAVACSTWWRGSTRNRIVRDT